MTKKATAKKGSKRPAKSTVKKRTMNAVGSNVTHGAPFQEQDTKRRLGNFTTAGEHARQGGRNGIIGQRKGKFSTDKPSTSKKSK